MIQHKTELLLEADAYQDVSGVGVPLGGELARDAKRRLAAERDRSDARIGLAALYGQQWVDSHRSRLNRFAVSLLEATSIERIARIATDKLRDVFRADLAGLLIVPEAGTDVVYFGANDAGSWSSAGVIEEEERSLPLAEVFQTGFPLWLLRGTQQHPLFQGTTEFHRVIGCAPLSQRGRRMGALGMSYLTRPQDVSAECGLFQEYATRIALAVSHAEAYERAQLERERADAERRRADFASRAKEELLAMLDHEVRNPLSAILAATAVLRIRAGQKFATELDTIERQVSHTAQLLNDLTDASRLARAEVELEREPVELGRVIGAAIELAKTALGTRSLVMAVASSGLMVEADAGRLAQAIANLLFNAVKYTTETGTISVEARQGRTRVELSVRDDGVGIEADLLARVFEVFAQGPQPLHRPRGGLGLGLAMARSIVELHGGTLRAESAGAGKGSLFTLELPRVLLPPTESATPSAPLNSGVSEARRVLLVDDNLDALELVRQFLEGSGYIVRAANDRPSALAIASAFRPELALLDLGLPGMDGYELARRLRALLEDDVPKLVALTGYGSSSARLRSTDAGFDEHVLKPVALPSLLKVMFALVG